MDMQLFLYYTLVICAYIPGLIGLFKFKFYGKFSLILFCFLGMFVFHALGSILVLIKQDSVFGEPIFNQQYIMMLMTEILIFYAITWPYIFSRKDTEYSLEIKATDYAIIPLIILAIVLILFIYRQTIGTFLISDLLSGNINNSNIDSFRAEKAYGSEYFSYFIFGFITFPAILASHLLLISLIKKRFSVTALAIILFCFIPPLLLGTKSGILQIVTILFITYTIYLGVNNKSPIKMITIKSLGLFLIAFIPTLTTYFIYFGRRAGILQILKSIVLRIFYVYSEALAATVPMVDQYGLSLGNTLPVVGSHPSLAVRMHYFLYNIEGSAPVPAVGEGYVNFGWPGFIFVAVFFFLILVILQELLRTLKCGLFSYSILVWFAYLAIYTNFIGLFATFLWPLNYVVFIFVFIIWIIDYLFFKSHNSTRRINNDKRVG